MPFFLVFALLSCSGKGGRTDSGTDPLPDPDPDTGLDVTTEYDEDVPDDPVADVADVTDDEEDVVDVVEEDPFSCTPGSHYCDGESSMVCDEDGTGGVLDTDCLSLAGRRCDPATGLCYVLCDRAADEERGDGCEFWAVDLDNAENTYDDAAAGQFAVAVANMDDLLDADVRVYRDTADFFESPLEVVVDSQTVSAGDVHVFRLPRLDVDGPNETDGTDDGPQSGMSKRTYRIWSTVPILAYQFNTLDQRFSNDASLLIPTHSLDTSYHVAAWTPANPLSMPPHVLAPNRAYLTIVGTQDGTTVRVSATVAFESSLGSPPTGYRSITGIPMGEARSYPLDRYHVLNLETVESSTAPDPTGSLVQSDKPVAVFSGVDLAVVGTDTPPGCSDPPDCRCCAEHLEVQVLPDSTLGTTFASPHSAWRNSSGSYDELDYYRVIAATDGTSFTTSTGVSSSSMSAGEFFELRSSTGFILEATLPVLLVRIITAKEQTVDGTGDPTMLLVPSIDQLSERHVFTTAEGFDEDRVVVSIPAGQTATLDGADVASTCGSLSESFSMGSHDHTAYTCTIADGAHEVIGSAPVSVDVYGYHAGGSYGFSAGLDP
jgi:hypothetical protein